MDASLKLNKANPKNECLTWSQVQNELFIMNYYFSMDQDSLAKSFELGIDVAQFEKKRGQIQGLGDGCRMVPGFYYLENGSVLPSQGIISQENGIITLMSSNILTDLGLTPYDDEELGNKGYNKANLNPVSFYSFVMDPLVSGDTSEIFLPQFTHEDVSFTERKPLKTAYKECLDKPDHIPLSAGLDLSHRTIFCKEDAPEKRIKIIRQPYDIPFKFDLIKGFEMVENFAFLRFANGLTCLGLVLIDKYSFVKNITIFRYNGFLSIGDLYLNTGTDGIPEFEEIFPLSISMISSIKFNKTSYKPYFEIPFLLEDGDLNKFNKQQFELIQKA